SCDMRLRRSSVSAISSGMSWEMACLSLMKPSAIRPNGKRLALQPIARRAEGFRENLKQIIPGGGAAPDGRGNSPVPAGVRIVGKPFHVVILTQTPPLLR